MKNLFYIGQWLLVKEWYEVDSYTKLKYSKLTLGQIEGLLNWVSVFRKLGWYKVADHIRNKLLMVGYFHFMPEKVTVATLSGHTHPQLKFKALKDRITIEGHVNLRGEEIGTRLYYEA